MSTAKFYNSELIQKAYTAKKALDFFYLILEQVRTVYLDKGMIFPVIASSTLLYISEHEPVSLTEISKALEHPHQVIAQRTATLMKLNLLRKQPDPNDKRRSEFSLTKIGSTQAALLHKYNIEAADVFQSIFDDAGVDIGAALDAGNNAMKQRTMAHRFSDLFGEEPTKESAK